MAPSHIPAVSRSLPRAAAGIGIGIGMLALAALWSNALAQTSDTVVITGRTPSRPSIGGFGDLPAATSPFQSSNIGSGQLADFGIASIGALTRWDASLGDAYNAEGYWSNLSARGYALDNRFNYRRDGLPINAETALALDNKDSIELLKGTSGIQAGSSAPGGLLNLVTKRPTGRVRTVELGFRESSSLMARLDIGDRFGERAEFGLRLNAASERLEPLTRDMRGQRSLLALAADWRFGDESLLEVELESSRQRQPSVVGFSLLGDTLPDAGAIDPRLNLNSQPWAQPVVLNGDTASLRWRQRLSADWRFTAHAMTQRLRSDDRTAFPYGVYEADYTCPAWCDRFAPDGSFTYWEYISDHERRRSDALDLSFTGRLRALSLDHDLTAGLLSTRYRGRFEDQVFDIAGPGRIDGTLDAPPSSRFLDANTNRDERSREWYLRNVTRAGNLWSLWTGLRYSQLERSSVRTSPAADGLRATSYRQDTTVPWLALALHAGPQTTAYLSWGEGLESEVAPNRARYRNAGQPLPALKSRQFEAGIKHAGDRLDAALTIFDIDRPQTADEGECDGQDSCVRVIDGSARHRGLEAQFAVRDGDWTWRASAMLLDARRRGSILAGVNGTRPVNVPAQRLRAQASYRVAAIPGLLLNAAWVAESDRVVLPYDPSVRIPGWSRTDLAAQWRWRTSDHVSWTWRAGVDNAFDRRAWKESPYQFGHAYLYPLAARTWRASAEAAF